MKCYHLYSERPVLAGEHHWYQVTPTAWLFVHDYDKTDCPPEPIAGHLLLPDRIPKLFADALHAHGVSESDTVAQMAVKMGAISRPFMP